MLEQQPILNLPGKQISLYIFSFLKLKKAPGYPNIRDFLSYQICVLVHILITYTEIEYSLSH